MAKWVVVVECEDSQEALETAFWLRETYDWPAYTEERD